VHRFLPARRSQSSGFSSEFSRWHFPLPYIWYGPAVCGNTRFSFEREPFGSLIQLNSPPHTTLPSQSLPFLSYHFLFYSEASSLQFCVAMALRLNRRRGKAFSSPPLPDRFLRTRVKISSPSFYRAACATLCCFSFSCWKQPRPSFSSLPFVSGTFMLLAFFRRLRSLTVEEAHLLSRPDVTRRGL